MQILLITQVFYPDTVSVSQHLWDLANHLQMNGHNVTVYTSKYPYENKDVEYISFEEINGIIIHRINQTKFGKANFYSRIIDFGSFNINISFKLVFTKKSNYDVIIGTTVPPFLSFIGVLFSKRYKIPFYYWVMDLQPELSIASKLISENSLSAKFFTFIGNYSIKNSTKIFSLDRFMSAYLSGRGAKKERLFTIPPWPVMDKFYMGNRLDNPFRIENNFGDKIVIMYSGNHAFVHPLETILEASKLLMNDKRFLFVFVGGGVRKKDVSEFRSENGSDNIIQLPFQPRENIHNSLGSSDLQVVIMGDNQLGFTHPNKVYGALFIGKPVLYIGPSSSHITDIINTLDGNISVKHGEEEILAKKLIEFANITEEKIDAIGKRNYEYARLNLSPEVLKNKMLTAIGHNV